MLARFNYFCSLLMFAFIEEALRLGAADLSGIDKKLDHIDD